MNEYDILKKYFGYDDFREGQHKLIEEILAGRDVLGIMPTGAGKSICYQVSGLLLPGVTVVISPLISLMKDQVQSLNQAGIHAAYINSSLTEGQIKKALSLAANGTYKIIYVAPERLETYDFKMFAQRTEISMVTVDEAHCISQWGQDFRPSYLNIVRFVRSLPKRPVISAFTATATETVKEDIVCVLDLHNPEILVTGFDRKNLYFGVETPKKRDAYVLGYVKEHKDDSGIIYCATRKNVDKIYELLTAEGIAATRYHAGISNTERKQNQDDYIYDKKPVVVATNAFGMGIDKSNVRYVLHYNMPSSVENYYQEAGRAGRDGEPSECILLYSAQDIMINRFLMEHKEIKKDPFQGNMEGFPDPTEKEDYEAIRERDEKRLQSMIHYCRTTHCLREYLLEYFGEHTAPECGNCSNCLQEFEEVDVTEEAMKIIRCVQELHQRFGINVVAGTLSGANTAKLRQYGIPEYESYGAMKEKSEAGVKEIINLLLVKGLLYHTEDKYALIKLTEESRRFLELETPVTMRVPKKDMRKEAEKYENASGKIKKRKARRSDILTSNGLELFDILREVRSGYAKEEGVPPYIVFSDKTLVDMCVKLPFDEEEMLAVSGVGANKLERFGARFIETIKEYTGGMKAQLYYEDTETDNIDEGNTNGTNSYGNGMTDRRRTKSSGKKIDFAITKEEAEHFPYREKCLLTEISTSLNDLRDPEIMKKISGAEIGRRLVAQGYYEEKRIDGKWKKILSEMGEAAGITLGMRVSKTGNEYEDLFFGEKAQRMIVEWFVR